MKRKIIKQGHSALTITLPAEWVKKVGLQAGKEVDLVERENTLIINGQEKKEEKSATIDITNFTVPLLWRFFQAAYRAGCDEIKVVFDPRKKEYEDAFHYYTAQFDYSNFGEKMPPKPPLMMIQPLVDRFMGMGIMESGKDYCVVREIGELTTKEFSNSLRRIFLVLIELFDRVIGAIKNNETGDAKLCKEIHTIDLNIDKFVDYCCRILNKKPNSFPDDKKMLLFSTLFILELLGDEFKYMGKHLALAKKNISDTLSLAKMVYENFNLYYKLFYKFDRETAVQFGKNDRLVYGKHFKIKNRLSGESRSIAKHLMMTSKFILGLTELRIEMEF